MVMSDQASSIPKLWGSLTFGNIEMGATFTGVARTSMIEDGENNVLSLKGATCISKCFQANQ
jgi:hypothetical protein